MGTKKSDSTPAKSTLKTILILGLLAAAAGIGAVYVNLGGDSNDMAASNTENGKPAGKKSSGLKAYSKGHMVTFVARSEPQVIPDFKFVREFFWGNFLGHHVTIVIGQIALRVLGIGCGH